PDGPVTVDVRLSGFKDFHEAVVVRPGQVERITPQLQLEDPLDFRPSGSMVVTPLKPAYVQRLVATHKEMFDACFGVDDPPFLEVRGYVAGSGGLAGFETLGPAGAPDELSRCIARAFRAQTFIIDEPGADCWSFEMTLKNPHRK
ncbi:MAG: hypothetical protein D6798_18895, partial [Deltaproteobacteria bacterium]